MPTAPEQGLLRELKLGQSAHAQNELVRVVERRVLEKNGVLLHGFSSGADGRHRNTPCVERARLQHTCVTNDAVWPRSEGPPTGSRVSCGESQPEVAGYSAI